MFEKIKMSAGFCREFIKATISLGNKSVGEVTVLHLPPAVIVMAVRACMFTANKDMMDFARRIWSALFPKFTEVKEREYVQQCVEETDPETGLKVTHVAPFHMENTLKQIHFGFAITPASLKAVCDDFIAYGRAHQERTIDAAKNFFNVVIDWDNAFQGVKLLARLREENGFNVEVNWTKEDTDNSRKFSSKDITLKRSVTMHDLATLSNEENADSSVTTVFRNTTFFKKSGKRTKLFVDDFFNKFSVSLLGMVHQLAERLSRYNPVEIEDTLDKIEARFNSDMCFRTLCHVAVFYAKNAYRTLTTAMTAEIKAVKKLYAGDPNELSAQVKAIRARYALAYREVGNQMKVAAHTICNQMGMNYSDHNLVAALIWASYRGEQNKATKEYSRVKSSMASNFADNICPDEFAKYMLALAQSKGYSVPEYTEDELTFVPAELRDAQDEFVAEFDLGVADTEYGEIVARENIAGEFIIRRNEKGHLVASRRVDEMIEVSEPDYGKITFITAANELTSKSLEVLTKKLAKGATVTIADYGYVDGKKYSHLLLVDGKVVGQVRHASWPALRNATEKKAWEIARDAMDSIYANRGGNQGVLELMRSSVAEVDGKRMPVAVITLKGVKHVDLPKDRKFEKYVPERTAAPKTTGTQKATMADVLARLRR